jgi:alpha-glucosidase
LRHYEDDGISQRYTTDYAITHITKRQERSSICITIDPREGDYDGAPKQRSYELRLPATFPPQAVKVNGQTICYARFPKAGEWGYDAYTLAPIIYTGAVACDKPLTVELTLDDVAVANQSKLYGKSGIFKRCTALTVEFKLEQGRFGETLLMLPKEYLNVSQCPNFIIEDPSRINEFIDCFDENRLLLEQTATQMTIIGDNFKQRLNAQIGTL